MPGCFLYYTVLGLIIQITSVCMTVSIEGNMTTTNVPDGVTFNGSDFEEGTVTKEPPSFNSTLSSIRLWMKEKSLGSSSVDAPVLERYRPDDAILPPPDDQLTYCRRPAKCERLNRTTCFGVKLPYTSTSLELVDDLSTHEQILERMTQLWEGLRHVPKCWAVIQPFLCATYMPKCEDSMVYLPSQEMCKMTWGPCRILLAKNNWPMFPRCDDTSKYPQKCKNDVRELKFNTSGQCQLPLVPTDNSLAFYEGVEGCGVQCESPYFTTDEHRQIHQLVAWGGSCCLIFNLFTVVTFFIDWRSANKYPALVIFYINCCFLVSCIGWLAQFMPGARQDIVCRKDGTLRMSEPRTLRGKEHL